MKSRLELAGERLRDEQAVLKAELHKLDPTDGLWREACERTRASPLSLQEVVNLIVAREVPR